MSKKGKREKARAFMKRYNKALQAYKGRKLYFSLTPLKYHRIWIDRNPQKARELFSQLEIAEARRHQ